MKEFDNSEMEASQEQFRQAKEQALKELMEIFDGTSLKKAFFIVEFEILDRLADGGTLVDVPEDIFEKVKAYGDRT